MAYEAKRKNSFNDKVKTASITKVDPQNKAVDLRFTTQDGTLSALNLSYQNVGATWGRLYMPQVGDRVMLDYTQGDLPVITGMKPTNLDYLPYLDPGELADTNSDGSYIHLRNARRRVKSTGALIDYDATVGPNGETDIELEPGGIVLGIRSKQDISTKAPRWYEHSYLAMFDNGDISLQARNRSRERGLLYFCGETGYSIWTAGDARPQEYIELDPVMKNITLVSDGGVHQHSQTDWKITVYNNEVLNVCNAMQINVGVSPTTIPANFDLVIADSVIQQGDFRFSNVNATGPGRYNLTVKGNVTTTTAGTVTHISQPYATPPIPATLKTPAIPAIPGLTTATSTVDGIKNVITHAVTMPTSTTQTIVDGAGRAISHIVPSGGIVGLGALASSLPATQAVAAQNDLKTLSTNIVATSLQNLCLGLGAASLTAGIPNAAAFNAIIAAAGFVTKLAGINPAIPNCSSIVRAIA